MQDREHRPAAGRWGGWWAQQKLVRCSAWRDTTSHIHGVLGEHKALSALLGVTSASHHPGVQEVNSAILER